MLNIIQILITYTNTKYHYKILIPNTANTKYHRNNKYQYEILIPNSTNTKYFTNTND